MSNRKFFPELCGFKRGIDAVIAQTAGVVQVGRDRSDADAAAARLDTAAVKRARKAAKRAPAVKS